MSEHGSRITDATVVLTGATGGIGQKVTERLAGAGARLILLGRRVDTLEELAARTGSRTFPGDISDPAFVEATTGQISAERGGPPDILINSAGVFDLAPFRETSLESLEAHLSVNLRAPFQLIRAWLPEMLDAGRGHIINVGSIAGRRAFPGNAAYCASKYGLRGLHEVLVEELKGTGVRATWVEPSAVDTGLWDRFEPDHRADLPSRREMLSPEAVSEAIYYAASQPVDVSIEAVVIRANLVRGQRQ